MGGAGFMKDMINSTKNNRSLVKGDSYPYGSFDKSYITGYAARKDKKKVAPHFFKKASPKYYRQLRVAMHRANRDHLRKKLILLFSIVAVVGIGSWFLLFG
ncbi:MAG: hypothetical protein ABJF11_17195 [Reichenbachiella sp.]|uniref:hypothetical protein n=1 Tax=Reichenbachiella sp. TaxID=2184521 RepID=UPI003262F62C